MGIYVLYVIDSLYFPSCLQMFLFPMVEDTWSTFVTDDSGTELYHRAGGLNSRVAYTLSEGSTTILNWNTTMPVNPHIRMGGLEE